MHSLEFRKKVMRTKEKEGLRATAKRFVLSTATLLNGKKRIEPKITRNPLLLLMNRVFLMTCLTPMGRLPKDNAVLASTIGEHAEEPNGALLKPLFPSVKISKIPSFLLVIPWIIDLFRSQSLLNILGLNVNVFDGLYIVPSTLFLIAMHCSKPICLWLYPRHRVKFSHK